MDAISISNFIFPMQIGFSEEERAIPQRVRIDVRITTNFSGVISSGELKHGIDYSCVRRTIREVATGQPFVLLETLGDCIVQKLFQERNVLGVKLRIRKLDRWKDAVPGIVMIRKK